MGYEENCNEYYLALLKSKIISRICNDENCVKLIDPKENEYLEIDDVLRGGSWVINGKEIKEQGYIFDYEYVNDTIDDSKVFICVEAVPTTFDYPLINILLYIHIYVHRSKMRLTSASAPTPSSPTKTEMNKLGFIGNRCDQLTQAIGKIFNGCDNIGGVKKIKPYDRGYAPIDIPNNNFYGKCMIFQTQISNVEMDNCEDN